MKSRHAVQYVSIPNSLRATLVSLAAGTCVTLVPVVAGAQTIFGGYDCGQWAKRPKSHPMEHWVAGYLSGLNSMHGFAEMKPRDPLDELNSMDQAYVWLDNFCKANPLRKLDGAAYELFWELAARRSGKR